MDLGLDDDGPLGLDEPPRSEPSAKAQITTLIQAGKKIQAIKAYREATGMGLKDAKNAVEAMQRDMRAGGGRR